MEDRETLIIAAAMTDACTPPVGTKAGSFHYIEHEGGRKVVGWWCGACWEWDKDGPAELAAAGWRYHSAVPEPDEVEALRKVVLELWRAEEPGGIFPAMKAAGLLDPTADYAQFSLTPLGRRALGMEG